ncbi:hypothetical protein Daesc_000760 [Daldinia eschscholtzii]|uniref:Uncharacterized protein n=1 Tax=Daldinia eschscholtzii TaxID=292717 RepID=A0AAX6MZC6_9PEZI
MASYTAPREPEPLPPGAFPTDDMLATQDSSLTSSDSHHQRNKLHKKEDPRGWSDEERAARRHQHTDSGVGLTDPDPSFSTKPQAHDRVNEGAFQSNNATLQNNDVTSGTNLSNTTRSPNYQGNDSKPGFMTGAYGNSNANTGSNAYSKSATEDISSSQNPTSSMGIGAAGPATGIATATTTDNTQLEQTPEDRNTIRNGLRQTSNVEHEDPYWGDVPRGTGIYNTVTGHGSPESATEGSVQKNDPSLSHGQQRVFPLATSKNAARDETNINSGSRFKESLDESATGAAAGLTASELAGKRRDHEHKDDLREPISRKPHEADTKKESKIGGLFHRDHKDEKETKAEKKPKEPVPSKDDRPLTERDAGVALAAATGAYGAKDHAHKHDKKARDVEHGATDDKTNALYQHPNEKVDSDDPFIAAGYGRSGSKGGRKITNSYSPTEDVSTRDHPFSSQVTEKPNERNGSKIGYGLAAAGVGAGAGYAAHGHAHNNSEQSQVHPNQQAFHGSTTEPSSNVSTQPSESTYIIGKPQLAVFSNTGETGAPSQRDQSLPHTSSSTNRSLDDPSHHGEYNVLSDGTPSGINIGDHIGDKNVVSSSPNATRDAATTDNHTGAKAAAAGAGVAGAGAAAARYTGKRKSNASSVPYEVSGANGPAPTDSTSGKPYKTLPTGTPSGVNVDDGRQYEKHNVATSSPTRHNAVDDNNHSGAKAAAGAAGVVGAGAAAKHHSHRDASDTPSTTSRDYQSPTTASSSTRGSTDSSHGGQYNVLPSGTPSGINIGERDDLGRKSLDNAPSKAKAPAAATAAAHPTATSALPASKKDVAGAAAATPMGVKPGDKVLHRCRKCGEENDITGYFRT